MIFTLYALAFLYTSFLCENKTNEFSCTIRDGKMLILDRKSGFKLMGGFGPFDTWLPDSVYSIGGNSKHGTKINPQSSIKPVENGFDIVINFKNNGLDTASIGEFFIGNFNLDQKIYYRNTNYTFYEDTFYSKNNIQFASPGRVYPSTSCYSPVTILRDDKYIVGVTLIYPIEEYKHTANHMFFGNFFDNAKNGWNMVIQINKATNGQKYYESGELAPGQRRVYRLHIRVGKVHNIDEDWEQVIQPYRDYFNSKYKQLYKKDSRSVIGYVGVNESMFSKENPFGYTNRDNDKKMGSHPVRPDNYGYKPFVDYVKKLSVQKRVKRVMIWTPSGLYQKHFDMNYPYQFASHLFTIGKSKGQLSKNNILNDPLINFKSLSNQVDELGMWWGHAGQVSYSWDDGILNSFDVKSIKDWRAAFREIDAASAMGVNCLGLDSFSEMPAWDQIVWLKEMNRRTKGKIKFISELYSFDIVHTLAGFMYAEWNGKSQHKLADYLIPENEKWMLIIQDQQGKNINKYIQQIVKWNYIPCILAYLDDDLKM